MNNPSKVSLLLAAALASVPVASEAAFILTLDPNPLEVTAASPTGTVDIVATNTGPGNDDLLFFTVSFAYVSGSTDIAIDPPATVSHFGGPFIGGAGLAPGASAVIGTLSFTMSGAVSPTGDSPISTNFGGTMFYQAISNPAVIPAPLTATVRGVPEPTSFLFLFSAAGLGCLFRRR